MNDSLDIPDIANYPPITVGSFGADFGSATFFTSDVTPRILMVDDEKLNSFFVAELLKRDGFRDILHTSDARRAMDIVREQRPDLILLDLCMPHLDGFDILAELRGDGMLAQTAVLLLTGRNDEDTTVKALDLGAWDVMSKPFHRSELLARIRRMLLLKAHEGRIRRYVQILEASLVRECTSAPSDKGPSCVS